MTAIEIKSHKYGVRHNDEIKHHNYGSQNLDKKSKYDLSKCWWSHNYKSKKVDKWW